MTKQYYGETMKNFLKDERGQLEIILGIVAVILIVAIESALVGIGIYNSLVSSNLNVDNQWSQVENQYQRRADLIPNLVEVVKGITKQEQDIYLEVTKLRSQWGEARTIEDKMQIGNEMDSAISRLLLVAENYPEIRSNENFIKMQAQVERTEDKIAVERKNYNDAIRSYNYRVLSFPSNVVAGMYGFKTRPFFEAVKETSATPKINFSN